MDAFKQNTELLRVNPQYARVRVEACRETPVYLKHLAPSSGTILNPYSPEPSTISKVKLISQAVSIQGEPQIIQQSEQSGNGGAMEFLSYERYLINESTSALP